MKNLKIISEVLEAKKSELKENSKLDDFIWDSMSQIKLLTILNEKHGKVLNVQKLKKLKTALDLDNLINSSLKKK
jgi:acyl carrier protein